jgi:hypothetical protein
VINISQEARSLKGIHKTMRGTYLVKWAYALDSEYCKGDLRQRETPSRRGGRGGLEE